MTETLVMEEVSLTASEARQLRKHEAVIRDAIEVIIAAERRYIEVGNALRIIRDKDLYRMANRTFADYCKETWNLSRIHAYRLIQASEVAENVSPTGNIPANERIARQLVPLLSEPKTMIAAWEQFADHTEAHGAKVTAGKVKRWLQERGFTDPPEVPQQAASMQSQPQPHVPAAFHSDNNSSPSAGLPSLSDAKLDREIRRMGAVLDTVRHNPGLKGHHKKRIIRMLAKAITELEEGL